MNDAWAAIVGAVVGGTASLLATWLQQRAQWKARERDAHAAMRATILKGALRLLPNMHVGWGILRELQDFTDQRSEASAERVGTSVSLLADPLPDLAAEMSGVSDEYFALLTALSAASTSVAEVRTYLGVDGLKRCAVSDGSSRRELSGFITGLLKSHVAAVELLRSDSRLPVLTELWTADRLHEVEDGMCISGCYIKEVSDSLKRLSGV